MVAGSSKLKTKFYQKPVFWIFLVIFVIFAFFAMSILFFIAAVFGSLAAESAAYGNVALIPIEGAIYGTSSSSYFGPEVASSEQIVSYIEDASLDSDIDAIVLYINSPGGSAVASDEIAEAVLESDKPTVAVIREVGASGAYWIASASDHVVANRMSITGSIGVISSYLEFSDLFENYGVTYQRLVSGDRKDIGSPYRELTAEEEAILQVKLDTIHDYFIDAIANNRGLDRSDVVDLATGEFYLGVEALELGLVDELGDLSDAETYLYDEYGIAVSGYTEYGKVSNLFDALSQLSVMHGLAIGTSLGENLVSVDGGSSLFEVKN